MTPPGRHEKPPNAGRVAAIFFALLAGASLVALGIAGAVSNRLTPREVVAGAVAIVVGAVAAFWLRREKGRRQ